MLTVAKEGIWAMDLIGSNAFLQQKYKVVMFLMVFIPLLGACHTEVDDIDDFGKTTDVTESVHHRFKAGMFDPVIDPFICEIIEPKTIREVPHQLTRISWDRGAFWVQADDKGSVVIYMDEEALFSHVQIATVKNLERAVIFREHLIRPIR